MASHLGTKLLSRGARVLSMFTRNDRLQKTGNARVRAVIGWLVGCVVVALVELVEVDEEENDGVLARVEDSEVVELAEFYDGEVLA